MTYVLGLKCKECGHRAPVSPVHVCEACFGPYVKSKPPRLRRHAGQGHPRVDCPRSQEFLAIGILPVEFRRRPAFHSGFTPLRKADRLARSWAAPTCGSRTIPCNYPTYSYKERVISVAIMLEFGFDTVGCASTGNRPTALRPTPTVAALAGMMIPSTYLEQEKVLGSLVWPTMVRIRGTYDDAEPWRSPTSTAGRLSP